MESQAKKNGKRRRCILIKHFEDYPDKVIYRGTLREAKKRIPPSKKGQFTIQFTGGN
jgi:hypothetical protein